MGLELRGGMSLPLWVQHQVTPPKADKLLE